MKKLNPKWVTGFTDAEGCFMVNFSKCTKNKIGWQLYPCFQIKLHSRDKDLLREIKSFFNEIGSVSLSKNNAVIYKVQNIKDIMCVIIPHFDKYPLITRKYTDYILWKSIIKLIKNKEHLTKNGILDIINLKSLLNNGLSEKLKIHFPNIIKIEKPKQFIPENIDFYWLAGFFSGDGCFLVRILRSKTHKVGYCIQLKVVITQHLKDELLINKIKNVLNCGYVNKYSNRNAVDLVVSRFKEVLKIIIPIFKEYKIRGIKSFDFEDFCKVAEIIRRKNHINLTGLRKIRILKSRMNKARYTNITSNL
jgi:hypothetical protein